MQVYFLISQPRTYDDRKVESVRQRLCGERRRKRVWLIFENPGDGFADIRRARKMHPGDGLEKEIGK